LGRPKQLIPLRGKILLQWVLEAALASRLEHTVVVLGHEASRIVTTLGELAHHPHLTILRNDNYDKGQTTSLHAGLKEVRGRFPAVMFLLGDQPLVGAEIIDHLLVQFHASDKDICVPVVNGKRSTPALFSERFFDRIFAITGDMGARTLIDDHPESVLRVAFQVSSRFLDVDDEQDLERLYGLADTLA
jgi:molybdenum cofactor cytidylyltransferase